MSPWSCCATRPTAPPSLALRRPTAWPAPVAAEPFLGGLAEFARAALAEDLGVAGDVTSSAILAPRARATAQLVARAEGVLAGWDAAAAVAATVELNLLGHLSGVATLTRAYVDAVAGTNAVIRDTRKTLPGLRGVQKAAVAAGGGVNHRHRLDDGILVKDNHAALAGGIDAATSAALAAGEAQGVAVQIEVDSPTQLHQALDAGARSVLCDNFALADLAEAVAAAHSGDPPAFVEASGGVTLDVAAAIAATGVDAIAVGALTHSAPALDIGLDVQPPS
ncbi:MAG: nicotinate-nucleotide diphosphorylase (carboxylating) [Actinobacteria bacterium QS_8_72_14]|nr:MAG: nicotinate-nucleotide diphosphorylase (carboxylating) [Actinobacteria bacterium QS_8_72_14]